MPREKNKLTSLQQDVIRSAVNNEVSPLTAKQIGAPLKRSSNAVYGVLVRLVNQGYMTKKIVHDKERNLPTSVYRVTAKGRKAVAA